MILINKKVGETPLELLNRLRIERPEISHEKLSYAGRLDPMAEGEMLVIVGEENKHRADYLGFDKEYVATFLVGVETDSGDILGLIKNSANLANRLDSAEIKEDQIKFETEKLLKIKKQKYPWFSGKTVAGIKLFDYFKKGNVDIERPTINVDIKRAEFLRTENISTEELKKYIFDSVGKVRGDFRQREILESWQKFFEGFSNKNTAISTTDLQLKTFEIRFRVSSGTFIRDFTNNFSFPTMLLKLKRTKIYTVDK